MEEDNKNKIKLKNVKAVRVPWTILLEKGLMMIENKVEQHEVEVEEANFNA